MNVFPPPKKEKADTVKKTEALHASFYRECILQWSHISVHITLILLFASLITIYQNIQSLACSVRRIPASKT